MVNTVQQIHTHYSNRLRKCLVKSWQIHVHSQMAVGGGSLFQYISKWDKQFLSVNWSSNKGDNSSPSAFLNSQVTKWSKYWCSTKDEYRQRVASELCDFREFALAQAATSTTSFENFEGTLTNVQMKHNKNTLGSNNWNCSELRALPSEVIQKLCRVMFNSLEAVAIPHQNLLNLNASLGKPNKDTRTVVKTPMLYRLTVGADEDIRQWELSQNDKFDTARVGSSALLAALKRNLKAELAFWLGQHSVTAFNDFDKFFDTIDIPTLLVEAVKNDFPASILAFVLQQHLAPRVIQANGFTSFPIEVTRSIIAGCKSSVALTRNYLKRSIKDIVIKHDDVDTGVFVDDTCMQVVSNDFSETLDTLVPAVVMFGDKVKALHLSLSDKATVTASSRKLSFLFAKEMTDNYAMHFNSEDQPRDVGISHSAGRARPKQLIKQRFNKRKHRITNIKNVAKIDRRARKLYTGSGFFSASTWGHQATSLPDQTILQMERDAIACSGITPAGRCRTLGLMVAYGIMGSPKARIVREAITAWFQILKSCDSKTIGDLRVAWNKARDVIENDKKMKNVHGFMSNIIWILFKAKWLPISMFKWKDPRGTFWTMSGVNHSPSIVAAAIVRDLFDLDLKLAENTIMARA